MSMTSEQMREERKALIRVLQAPDGQRFMEKLERTYVWGDPPKGDDLLELGKWLGARGLVLDLRAQLDANEGKGT